jgi:hypothetical protein
MAVTFINPIRSGLALAKQMRGDNTHPINCIYIEYQNVASAGDTAVVPSATTQEGLEYYNNLGANHDFIRAPITGLPDLTIAPSYTPYFGDSEGNTLTMVAITAAVAGELGRPFNNAVHSKVYGLALVSVSDWNDRTRDVVIQRAYYSSEPEQVIRPASGSFGAKYPITFGG